ncbi:MAG: cytochrome C biogenesis protein [Nitrospirae bacterium]|nr:cytochrome C biogenesis protein [Nitrospirota bacterium]
MTNQLELSEKERKIRAWLIILAFILFSIFVFGMVYLATNPATTVTATLSYAAGLSMITLPCTFPLVFVIVPLSMGKGYKKGFFMALLFGLGLTITITLYAVIIAAVGSYLGMDRATTIMYVVAGVAAFLFGLSELKLIKFEMPTFGRGIPSFIVVQRDYLKALLMGLFLGNAGVACPNPAFYVLLTYIATVGSTLTASILGAIHGIGRATPLILLAILGILGVNATQSLVRRRLAIEKLTGWFLVVIGAVMLAIGIYGHHWLLATGLHGGWDALFAKAGGVAEYECCIEPPCKICLTDNMWKDGACFCRKVIEKGSFEGVSNVCGQCAIGLSEGRGVFDMARRTSRYALSTMAALIVVPIGWYYLKRKRREVTGDDKG